MSKSVIHLHWGWRQGPAAARGVTLGASACGVFKLTPSEFTSHLVDATCPQCKEIAKRAPIIATPPPPNNEVLNMRQGSVNDNGIINMLVKHNPRKAGSPKAARFGLLMQHNGKSVKEFLKAGGNALTLKNAIKEKLVQVNE